MVRESYTLEDSSRYYKDDGAADDPDRKLVVGDKGGGSSSGPYLQKGSSSAAMATTSAAQLLSGTSSGCRPDSPGEWKAAPHEKDLKKWREMEPASLNGAQVWRERGDKRERVLTPGMDLTLSPPPPPPRRSVRSETPDDDSVSFHETLGRELRCKMFTKHHPYKKILLKC
jgi:hypothetical protein